MRYFILKYSKHYFIDILKSRILENILEKETKKINNSLATQTFNLF